MFFQARVVTDPIKNPIIGWWLDHWWFYVPFSALPNATALKELMITEGATLAAISSAANVSLYHKNGPNFLLECLQVITETYFREREVAWNAAGTTVNQGPTPDTLPIIGVNAESWLDSVIPITDVPTTDGVAVDEVVGLYDDLDNRRLMYERLLQLGMTTATSAGPSTTATPFIRSQSS